MHTAVQKSQSVRSGSGILKVNTINLGMLKEAKFVVDSVTYEIKGDNAKLPPRTKVTSVEFSASLQEIHIPNFNLIDGKGTIGDVTGGSTNVVAEALGGIFTAATPIKLAKASANGTVTSLVVKKGGTTLTAGTAYNVAVMNGATYIVPVTSDTGAFTADYTYTAVTAKTYTINDMYKILSTYELTFENTDSNGKKFTITIPKGYASGNLELGFLSDDDVENVMSIPFKFKATGDDLGRMLVITDEASVS